ncbi:hypothetical protein PMZ80_007155 [Knufia obscura]|uniref:RING-type domain-containing protein n=1 Tax=Knufia obscura TaxID=1635080 RepID=A0ABR0RJE4_9EURO|nr:hypothetical protein PMZ80_007155 [Knufia obscura]
MSPLTFYMLDSPIRRCIATIILLAYSIAYLFDFPMLSKAQTALILLSANYQAIEDQAMMVVRHINHYHKDAAYGSISCFQIEYEIFTGLINTPDIMDSLTTITHVYRLWFYFLLLSRTNATIKTSSWVLYHFLKISALLLTSQYQDNRMLILLHHLTQFYGHVTGWYPASFLLGDLGKIYRYEAYMCIPYVLARVLAAKSTKATIKQQDTYWWNRPIFGHCPGCKGTLKRYGTVTVSQVHIETCTPKGCPLCSRKWELGETVPVLPCQHIYHEKCLDWAVEELQKKSVCPDCAKELYGQYRNDTARGPRVPVTGVMDR